MWALVQMALNVIHNLLAREGISAFKSYAKKGKPDTNMKREIGFDDNDYVLYTACYLISMIPSMLLLGPFADQWNKRRTLAFNTFIWSLAMGAQGFVTRSYMLFPLMMVVGIAEGIGSSLPITMNLLYFAKPKRIRAYFVFALLI